jgi:hypothetical protein
MPIDSKEAAERMAKFRKGSGKKANEQLAFFAGWCDFESTFRDLGDPRVLAKIGKAYREMGILKRPLFLASFPSKLRRAMNKALEMADVLPYQQSFFRLPFRAPHIEEVTDVNRGQILESAYALGQLYDEGPAFFAEWGGYMLSFTYGSGPSLILAGAIDAGDDEVFQILVDTLRGQHPVGAVSRAGIRALLLCQRTDGWSEVERVLLAAQREEGLRQTIFESVDELNPKSFVKFVRTIIEHDLLRFSSVIRAVAVWFPGLWAEGDEKSAAKVLGRLLEFLGSKDLFATEDYADVYLRLWSLAFEDVACAIRRAETYLANSNPSVRRSAVQLLARTNVTHALPLLKTALNDPDLSVASIAISGLGAFSKEQLGVLDIWDTLWEVASKWPKSRLRT